MNTSATTDFAKQTGQRRGDGRFWDGTPDLQVRDGVIEIRAIRRNPREGPAAFHVPLTFQGKQGLIVLDQIRTVDRLRLVKRLGVLRAPTLALTQRG